MGKKKNKDNGELSHQKLLQGVHPRKMVRRDMFQFEQRVRKRNCFNVSEKKRQDLLSIDWVKPAHIRTKLACCSSIEDQIITLRDLTQLTGRDYEKRYRFTQCLLDCLYSHHRIAYEGILFGSSLNGLGSKDSDVDLRLRPLKMISDHHLEPISYDSDMVERTLRNIAFQTTRCTPAVGVFVPSQRCPIAKLKFLTGDMNNLPSMREGINYDISLSSATSLGSLNTLYIRFLCKLEPRFHLMASILRYWSKYHDLIVPGFLSSYAVVNMLIFFCQTTSPPLLPTVDQMRETYFAQETDKHEKRFDDLRAITQIEWQCLVSLNKSAYAPSANEDPVCLLLLKFFEFYLTFRYSDQIITTRPGRALTHDEFKQSSQYDPRFPIRSFLNIQDPFDLKHNLTSGMSGEHFRRFIVTIRHSYERLFREILCNFTRPVDLGHYTHEDMDDDKRKISSNTNGNKHDIRDWGLNALFVVLTKEQYKNA